MSHKSWLASLKRHVRAARGLDILVRPNLKTQTAYLGSDYGGWEICLSGLDTHSIIYSFGIGDDVSFDLALMGTLGATIHAFDPTPRSLAWLETQDLPQTFVAHGYGLADFDGEAVFFPPKNPAHMSHTIVPGGALDRIALPVKRLKSIMAELGHDHVDLLKMDIEGAEYGVIRDMEASGVLPAQVLVEFHHRRQGCTPRQTADAIAVMRGLGYRIFAVSSCGSNYGFLRSA